MVFTRHLTHALILAISLFGCSSQGTSPHDMSASEHEAHAGAEDAEGARHLERFDPGYTSRIQVCSGDATVATLISPCWSELRNPSDAHLHMAQEHFERAAEHRAASEALRVAEEEACTGIEPADRDRSPFEHAADVAAVRMVGDANVDPEAGVAVTLRPLPGLTAQWLESAIACHVARNAALGHEVAEMPDCPLVPEGARASVEASEGGLVVTVMASGPRSAVEIQARGARLSARVGSM